MSLLSPAIQKLIRLRYWSMEQWYDNAVEAQLHIFQNLLYQGQYTWYGKQYNFEKIKTIKEYQQQVPLVDYTDIQPLVERILHGEEDVLWNTPVYWMAKSSGTTGSKSKFIPLTKEILNENHYLCGKDVLSFYLTSNPDSNLVSGKGLIIGGSHKISQYNQNIVVGDLSAILMQQSPLWGSWLRTPNLDILLLDDFEKKIELITEQCVNENVTSLSGVPTWMLVLLRNILQATGKSCIKEVWPQLELYMHGGVSFVPYKQEFEKLIGEPIKYWEMYNASEGFIAAQTFNDQNGITLLTGHGIFYEFIPMAEWEKPAEERQCLNLEEVETNINYALIISTSGGLWRYVIGDTVMFTSLKPYTIKVTGRTAQYINAFGEEVMVFNTDEALSLTCKQTEAVANDYTVAPKYPSQGQRGAHEWIIAFEKQPDNLDTFIKLLDANLKLQNSDYEAKRTKDLALTQPIVHARAANFFANWLKQKGKLGGQNKVPRLSNNRGLLEELLGM
jgi:hypothetical protein